MSGATPGDTAPDQVARLLALVPFVLARGEVHLEEAAAHFGTDADQIERDLRLLFMTGLSPGLPGDLIEVDLEALEGERVIRVDNADYLARPVRFSPAEATALVVALRTMLDSAPEGARDVVGRTLAKLEVAAGAAPADLIGLHVASAPLPEHSSSIIRVLERAIGRGHRVELTYHVPSRDQQSQRSVDPRGLSRVEDLIYLDAWCHTAQDERVFRVDRIVSAKELDTPILDPSARPRDLTGGWFTGAETTTVTLSLEPAARWVTEYYPVTHRRTTPDGTLEIDLEVASEEWLRALVLRLAPHARVVSPPQYAVAITQAARATLRLYEDGGVGWTPQQS